MSAFEFFWNERSPFSQFHPSLFQMTLSQNGEECLINFVCAEQAMMYQKANLFGDYQVANEILTTTDPKAIKQLGRKVANFNEEIWCQRRERIVYDNNLAKFTQNPHLLKKLLATGDKTLVEASPYDRIWGIGLAASDQNANDPKKWRGLNLLGKILTRLRNELGKSIY